MTPGSLGWPGGDEWGLVSLHGLAEGGGGGGGAMGGDGSDGDDQDDDAEHDGDGDDDRLAILAGPLEAVSGGGDEVILLECGFGLLIHGCDFPYGTERWARGCGWAHESVYQGGGKSYGRRGEM